MAKYTIVVCGGTFDLFHKGHEELIKNSLNISDRILIGITSNSYIKSFKNMDLIRDYKERKQEVINFLNKINARKRAIIVPINSAYEPYLETSNKYQAIVVSDQTKKTALQINTRRQKNKIKQLDIIVVPAVLAKDKKMISSTRIRNGEINRDGNVYVNSDWKNKDLILPNKLRLELKTPWGIILKNIPKNLNSEKTLVVGDAVSKQFNKHEVGQFLSVIDFLINREKRFKNISEVGFRKENVIKIKNPPGMITFKLFKAIEKVFKKNNSQTIILIDGEDDLSVLPIILLSPLGYNIFYGQPDVGIVWIRVDEAVKTRAYKLVTGFKFF